MVKPRILVVDDEEPIRKTLRMTLEYEGYDVSEGSSGAEALDKIENEPYDLVFLDIKMPGMDGFEVLGELRERTTAPQVVVVSGHANVQTAVQATKLLGAFDFIEKPLETERILLAVRNALERKELKEEVSRLRPRFERRYQMVGTSSVMDKVREAIARSAPTNATVLVTGESGTGKELVARAIHTNSNRTRAPWIQVNCAAIPEDLIESELFGHEKGSFTNGRRRVERRERPQSFGRAPSLLESVPEEHRRRDVALRESTRTRAQLGTARAAAPRKVWNRRGRASQSSGPPIHDCGAHRRVSGAIRERCLMTTAAATKTWKRQDFASDQDVRWCPGCGDYVVLSSVHRTLAAVGRAPHENVFISGIGCSSRFPYYRRCCTALG